MPRPHTDPRVGATAPAATTAAGADAGAAAPADFRRDAVTVVGYLAVAGYAFYLYAMGPVTAYLRRELHLSYAVTSLHSTMWAAGTILTGVAYAPLVRRLGRPRLFWSSAVTMVLGAGLLALAPAVGATLAAAGLMGTAGTTLQTAASAVLADRHAALRDRAFVESNIGGSTAAVLAPAVLGALQPHPGWRLGLLVPPLILAAMAVTARRLRVDLGAATAATAAGGGSPPARLPRGYWPLGTLVALVVGIEFCVIYFAPQLLHAAAGLSTDGAATALSAFYLGELLGRLAGAPLARRPGRTAALTMLAFGVTLAGIPLLWLSGRPVPAVLGLFVVGLGVANLYPLSLGLAVTAARGRTDAALAMAQLLVGVAVAVGPLTLGALADHIGAKQAFVVEPALVVASAVLLALSLPGVRAGRRRRRTGT